MGLKGYAYEKSMHSWCMIFMPKEHDLYFFHEKLAFKGLYACEKACILIDLAEV